MPDAGSNRSISIASTPESSLDARVNGWLDVQGPVFQVDMSQDGREAAHWRFDLHHLGESICGAAEACSQTIRRDRRVLMANPADHVMLDLLVSAEMSGTASGAEFSGRPGDIVVFDMAQPVAFEIRGPDRQAAWRTNFLVMPRSLIDPDLKIETLHGAVLRGETALGRIVGAHLSALAAEGADLSAGEADSLGQGSSQLIGGALAALGRGRVLSARRSLEDPLMLALNFIRDQHGRADLTPGMMAGALGISRTRLYALFEPLGGVADYIREHRLRAAYKALVTPGRASDRISQIAYRHGFASDASFRRSFQRTFGLSPREARDQGRHPGSRLGAPAITQMETWLREL